MLSKPFFGYAKPKFNYEQLSTQLPRPTAVATPATVTLLLPRAMGPKPSTLLQPGTRVKTGQLLKWDEAPGPGVVSSVTGTIQAIGPYMGDYGRKYTAVTIAAQTEDQWSDQFAKTAEPLNIKTLADFLTTAPGAPPLDKIAKAPKPIHTVVIYGGDTDLLVDTNLFVLKSQLPAIEKGIQALKEIAGIEKIILAVPGESVQNYDGHFEAEVRRVPAVYPFGQPLMIYYQLFGQILEQGQSFTRQGVVFMRAEAVATIGRAISEGRVPIEKMVAVMDKKGNKKLVSARIGTPISELLKVLHIVPNDRDRIIFGGPMTGKAVYATDQPVEPDTDAIVVQDGADIIASSDYPCINCGECIRVCPSRIAVNMLVRFLEAGQYQDGADLYDLYSCVECGLCSIICVSRIPILQYIKLAKYELARTAPAEEENNE
ncbi:MAG: 4Fe-4S dicluster domain-containing protein [Desulfobacteraceae bacterium]|nr:4Fe-4S dicluster domain-containing protein [Desulfobacteraceae bacterium]